jgi:light-regulated signal transduction histidine kinase (bacteriophytochrome)
MNFELVDLSAMVEELIGELKGQDTNRDVTVNITSGLSALCDPHLMRVALTNLINNSWKYTSKIPSANIEFGLRFCNSEPAFFIEDNGAGFDMAYAGKLFGAFQRMHSAEEFSGSGVGLATVKRVISRHGGQVWAEAEVGKGATFYFTLPTREFALPQAGEKS